MKTVYIVVLQGILFEGEKCAPGTILEVTEREAIQLLWSEKARLATGDDEVPEDV